MYVKKILWTIAVLGLIVFAVLSFYIYQAMFSPNTAFNNDEAFIYIKSNATYADVRSQLKPLLLNINTFDALAKQKKYTTNIKAGKYVVKKNMTNNAIINSIRSKNLPVKVSFNNQHKLEELASRISKQIEADSVALLAVMTDKEFLKAKGFEQVTAIAMYIPNSYEFFWNTSASVFRARMYKEYKKFWTASRLKKAKAINLTPTEVITLASIVYEESKQPEEQPRIAGVYLNRLRVKMKLDADPTIKFAAYQLPKYKNTIIRRILNIHKIIDSPYNTYIHKGLPPGPVAMPDISAIKAVLNPEKHNYFYFVANHQNPGYHSFAKTLAQHNANAKTYRRYLSNSGIFD